MALVDTTLRESQTRLCTQQHRLRHLQSISACNVQACEDCCHLHFTMHLNETSPDFYASERCSDLVSPKWRNFDVSQFPEFINTSISSVVVRIWCQHGINDHVIIEWTVNFSGLQFIGEQIMKNDRKYKPNTIVLRMHNYYYTDPTCLQFLSPSKQSEKIELLKSVLVERQLVRNSYSVSSLQRIHTIQRAIKQTQASIWRTRSRINERLQDVQMNEEKRADKEYLRMFLGTLRSQMQHQKNILTHQREQLSRLIGVVHDRSYELVKNREALRIDRDNYCDTRIQNGQSKELLLKTNAELALRRTKLISELPYIYPINEIDSTYAVNSIKIDPAKLSCLSQSAEVVNKGLTICNVFLPNSEELIGHDETKITAALGYVVHLVLMIAEILDVPLRYPVRHIGSRSKIYNHILDTIPEKEQE
uniref:UV radiation resistance-associated gene protein n=1 Tax=Strigamia maritima TaxID=126957 RepID=T1JLS3_STRMM